MSGSELRELLGDPFEISKDTSAESWRYFVQITQREGRLLFNIIPVKERKWIGVRDVVITLVDNSVVKVSDQRDSKHK